MKTLAKLIVGAAASAALILGGATAATAAKPMAVGPTFTFDADGTALPVAAAAADWSKNTDINVVTGECTSGNYCVHFKVMSATIPCSQYNVGFVNGCAYRLPDGACQVEVWHETVGRINLATLITKHEAGHCIFAAGGRAMSYHLPAEPHALMSAVQPGAPSKKDAMLTQIDREFTRSLF